MSKVRLIDANALQDVLYHEAFETDSDMQRWDSGCWIRYKMFENAIDNAPTINPTVDKDYLIRLIQEAVYDGEACARLIDMVEPCGDDWERYSDRLWKNAYERGRKDGYNTAQAEAVMEECDEPKQGHWILSQDEQYEYCTCSECGYENGENWMIGSEIPFCANCGAKMTTEESSIDESIVSNTDTDNAKYSSDCPWG